MRQEFKYLVPVDRIPEIRERIQPFVIRDDHVRTRQYEGYTVRSIYLDSPSLSEYHKKLAGVFLRKKLRIRGYNTQRPDSRVFLEIKHKKDNSISKNRAPLFYHHLKRLLNTGDTENLIMKRSDFPNAIPDAERFLYCIHRNLMLPVVLVIYNREAYIGKFDHADRITFDCRLRSVPFPKMDGLFRDDGAKFTFTDHFILEIKSNTGFPHYLRHIISDLNVKREALSKYTMSIDTHPELIRTDSSRNTLIFAQNFRFIHPS